MPPEAKVVPIEGEYVEAWDKVKTKWINKGFNIDSSIDESKNIYKVAINPSLLFWGGAKEDAYKKIKPLLNKEPIYRTYDWTIASRSAVFLESIPLRESSIRQLRLG